MCEGARARISTLVSKLSVQNISNGPLTDTSNNRFLSLRLRSRSLALIIISIHILCIISPPSYRLMSPNLRGAYLAFLSRQHPMTLKEKSLPFTFILLLWWDSHVSPKARCICRRRSGWHFSIFTRHREPCGLIFFFGSFNKEGSPLHMYIPWIGQLTR
jgi:hypothetical protein